LQKDLNELKCEYEYLEKNPSPWHFTRAIWRNIRQRDYDLIHSHGLTSGIYALVPSILSKVPHLVTLHDVFNKEQFEGLKGFVKRFGLSIAFWFFDTINCVSQDAMRNLYSYFSVLRRYQEKVVVILNGIETERFLTAPKIDLREELNLPRGSFLIGFLGRFMSQKGFIYLIDALERILKRGDLPKRPAILTFGKGAGFYREDMGLVQRKGLADWVHLLEFRPNIAPTLKGLDLVVMPSLWEACGLVAMEVMVAGVPLIGTNCIGLREVLKDTPAIVVPVKDAEALADAIIKEMMNPSKAKFEAFAPEAAERFDVKDQARELEKVILSLIRKEKCN
jgi:glycosyltransferase involved in cell wall biosynthesis